MGIKGFEGWTVREQELFMKCGELIARVAEKYGVDAEEILIGTTPVPPEHEVCLAYVEMRWSSPFIYIRRGRKADGRWTRDFLKIE